MYALIIISAIALTALTLCCIWVASDADDYSENRREKDEENSYTF